MRENFDKAFQFVLKWEGGYVNDPDDPGGETKYGISKRAYPDLDIKNLTVEQAKEIYFYDYWVKGMCDGLPAGVDLMHFDFCVNGGVKRAGMVLQETLNEFFNEKLVVDGVVGPKTLLAVSKVDTEKLLGAYALKRVCFYAELGKEKFLRGWLNRVKSALKEAFYLVKLGR